MSTNRGSSMQNGLIDPVTLTFDLLTPKAYHFEYIRRSFLIPNLNTVIIRFWVMLRINRQRNKQTDIVGVGNDDDDDNNNNNNNNKRLGWALDRVHNSRRPLDCLFALCDRDLDLWPFDPKIMTLVGYPKVILYTKFEHFGIIRFWVRPIARADRQTDRQTPLNILLKPMRVNGPFIG